MVHISYILIYIYIYCIMMYDVGVTVINHPPNHHRGVNPPKWWIVIVLPALQYIPRVSIEHDD